MSIILITPPAIEPVTVEQAKAAIRVSTSDEDAYIAGLIKMAREIVEYKTNRALLTQSWQAVFDGFPISRSNPRVIPLERSPLQSVTSVQYLDFDFNVLTFDPVNYRVALRSEPGRVILKTGLVWPIVPNEAETAIVNYVAGYGSDPASIPTPLIESIFYLVAHFYATREPVLTGLRAVAIPVPQTFELSLYPYKVHYTRG